MSENGIELYGTWVSKAMARKASRQSEQRTRAYGRIVLSLIERRGVTISYEELWDLVLGDDAMETAISNVIYELEDDLAQQQSKGQEDAN